MPKTIHFDIANATARFDTDICCIYIDKFVKESFDYYILTL